MPYKCTVRGCTGNTKNGPKVQVFGFPRDPELSVLWAKAIGKEEGFVPSYSSKVCILHFKSHEIRRETTATDSRTGKTVICPLTVPRLKRGAIPSVFPNPPAPNLRRCTFPRGNTDSGKSGVEQPTSVGNAPAESGKVCELHFRPDDIRRESYAVDESTGEVVSSAKLKVPQLNKGAIPSLMVSYRGPETWRRRRRRRVDDGGQQNAVTAPLANGILSDGNMPPSLETVFSIHEKLGDDGTRFPRVRMRSYAYCAVPQCGSKGSANPDLRFHCIPPPGQKVSIVNEGGIKETFDRRDIWISRLGIKRQVTKGMVVCSRHFQRSDYILPDFQKKHQFLKRNAIPSLNLASQPLELKPMAMRGIWKGPQGLTKVFKLVPTSKLTPTVFRVMTGSTLTAVPAPLHGMANVPGSILTHALLRPDQGHPDGAPMVGEKVPVVHKVLKQVAVVNKPQPSTAPRGEELDAEGTGAIVPDLDWKLEVSKRKPGIAPEKNAADEDSSNRLGDDVVVSCRTCFGPCRSARKIFAEQEPGKLLYETINDIYELDIQLGDGLAEYVCDTCYQSILRFQRFKKTSHEGHVALTSIKKKLSEDKMKSMDNLCRLCVNQSHMYGHIFSRKHRGVHIYEIINNLCRLNVTEDDDLPAWVCEGCHNEVVEFSDCKRFAHRDMDNNRRSNRKEEEFSEGNSQTALGVVKEEDDGEMGEEGSFRGGGEEDEEWMPMEGEGEEEEEEGDYEEEDEMMGEKNVDDEEDMGDEGISIDSFLETKLEEGTNLELRVEEGEGEEGVVLRTTPSREAEMPSDPVLRKRSEKWGLKRFSCPICKKPFALRHHLTIHVRTHTGEKPYRCKYCSKPFASHSGLSVHVRIHTGHKPHACNVCGKRFTQSGTAKEHAKIHSEEREHKCEKCGKAFAQKRTYVNHVRSHEKDTPVKCGVCGAMLASMANWRKHHALAHLKRRPFECDVCDKEFATSWAYRSHYRMHSGEKPYECKICLMRFANPSGYKLHIRKH